MQGVTRDIVNNNSIKISELTRYLDCKLIIKIEVSLWNPMLNCK